MPQSNEDITLVDKEMFEHYIAGYNSIRKLAFHYLPEFLDIYKGSNDIYSGTGTCKYYNNMKIFEDSVVLTGSLRRGCDDEIFYKSRIPFKFLYSEEFRSQCRKNEEARLNTENLHKQKIAQQEAAMKKEERRRQFDALKEEFM